MTNETPWTPPRHQRGATLLEALIGFLIVSVGWLGAAQLQLVLRQGADLARQQAEAGRLAQDRLERLRMLAATAPGAAGDTGAAGVTVPDGDTRFDLQAVQTSGTAAALTEASIIVRWPDAVGVDQRIVVSSAVVRQSAALVLPLTVARASRHTGMVDGRHAAIPREAADLGDGRSLFRPARSSSQGWLFDNRSARIVADCDLASDMTAADLARADLSSCRTRSGLLLAGRLRIAPASGPESLAADVTLQRPDGSAAPAECISEAVRAVEVGSVQAPRTIAVDATATPADHGLQRWRETGDRFVRYHCVVTPEAGSGHRRARWSGRLAVVPNGWTLGRVEGTRRVCRQAVDSDASGAIDRPAEAPDIYRAVDEALVEQNYLIVAGTQECPVDPAGFEPVTVVHQP